MSLIKNIMGGLVVGVVGLALASSSSALAKDIPAKVVRVTGMARYTTDNTMWHPLTEGQIVPQGAVIQTGEASKVDIILGEGSVNHDPAPMGSTTTYNPAAEQNLVRLSENTTLGLDKLTSTKTGGDTMEETQLDLRAGAIFGTVKKLSATSKYEIKLPNGVAGVRGTIYWVSAVGVIAVLDGSVVVAYTGANGAVMTQEVPAGYQFDTRTGQLTPLPEILRSGLIPFAWESRLFVNQKYQIEVDHTIYDMSPIGDVSPSEPALDTIPAPK